ncbi:MAG: thermonuclease family protein [Desulfosarcina sp.]|nr:thermonuclease family protein [Desulfosarcina sp.]
MVKFKNLFLIFTILFAVPYTAAADQYQVLRIVDGDTIVIDYNGTREKIRFLCVNPPESVHPDRKQNIPMGKVASDYTKKRLSGKSVGIELETKTRGRYGRLLAYVFVDGKNFNLELVQQGLSPYYTKYGRSGKYDQAFRDAEKSARDLGLNIWGDPELREKYLRLKSKWGQR